MQAFEETELPKLKIEKPGLTLNQYKDMIWKLWKKSPDNPLNQVSPRLLFWEFLVYFQTHDILCKKISISFFCHHLFFCVHAHLLMVICMDLVSNTDQLVSDTIYSVVLAKELIEGPPFKTTLIV